MALCCTVGYKWVTVMDGIKFESNDIISLYTKKDFKWKRRISVGYIIFYAYTKYVHNFVNIWNLNA